MFCHKSILILVIVLKSINADVVICENNECKRAGLINKNDLFYELDKIKEGNKNMTRFLRELNERFDRKISTLTRDIENIKEILHDQAAKTQPTDENKDDESTEDTQTDHSLYDNLWIVIQVRQDGSVDFYRNWTDYKNGFGDESGEFFLGLDKIASLTNDRDHELLVMLQDFGGNVKFAHYDHFLIGDETERYRLKELGNYSGTAGNHLKFHKKMFFTTKDRDNDNSDEGNCAHWFKGAWWYYNCMTSNLNGPYKFSRNLSNSERGIGITWGSYDGIQFSYKAVQMLLRVKV